MRHGPSKDYDGLYGDAICRQCKWYGTSKKIAGRPRCYSPINVIDGRLGTCFFMTPIQKNHLGRCPDFESKTEKPTEL